MKTAKKAFINTDSLQALFFSKRCINARISWDLGDSKNMCRGDRRFLWHLQLPEASPSLPYGARRRRQRTPLFFHLATETIKLLPGHFITFQTKLRTDIQVRYNDNQRGAIPRLTPLSSPPTFFYSHLCGPVSALQVKILMVSTK